MKKKMVDALSKTVEPQVVFKGGNIKIPLEKILNMLFDQIKHGDEEHQKWLKDKIDEFYNKLI